MKIDKWPSREEYVEYFIKSRCGMSKDETITSWHSNGGTTVRLGMTINYQYMKIYFGISLEKKDYVSLGSSKKETKTKMVAISDDFKDAIGMFYDVCRKCTSFDGELDIWRHKE